MRQLRICSSWEQSSFLFQTGKPNSRWTESARSYEFPTPKPVLSPPHSSQRALNSGVARDTRSDLESLNLFLQVVFCGSQDGPLAPLSPTGRSRSGVGTQVNKCQYSLVTGCTSNLGHFSCKFCLLATRKYHTKAHHYQSSDPFVPVVRLMRAVTVQPAEEDEEGKDLVSYGDCSPSLGCSVCIFKMCSLDWVNISQKLT